MESKNAQGQIGRKSKLSRLLSLKWMDVFCLSKENVASIQGGRRSKQEILSRWGSTRLWADLVQGCSATPKQFASVPLLRSSFHTKPSLPVPPFSTGIQPSGHLLAALPWLVAQGTPFQSLPQPPPCSTELWHYVRSSLKWGLWDERLQLSSNLPVPLERGQSPSLLPNSSPSLTCVTCATEVLRGPLESLGMKVNPFSISNSFYGNN